MASIHPNPDNCDGCVQVTVMDTSNVQIVYPAATTASTQKPPLLGLELQVSEGTKITCKTDLDSIVPRMLALFDKAITVTQVCWRCPAVP